MSIFMQKQGHFFSKLNKFTIALSECYFLYNNKMLTLERLVYQLW